MNRFDSDMNSGISDGSGSGGSAGYSYGHYEQEDGSTTSTKTDRATGKVVESVNHNHFNNKQLFLPVPEIEGDQHD